MLKRLSGDDAERWSASIKQVGHIELLLNFPESFSRLLFDYFPGCRPHSPALQAVALSAGTNQPPKCCCRALNMHQHCCPDRAKHLIHTI